MKVKQVINPEGTIVAYLFKCPGCNRTHTPYVQKWDDQPVWGFNGSEDAPTFTPSILYQTGDKNGPVVCHSFVTDGKIRFLGDCTHSLANQTIDLPDIVVQ